MLEDSGAWRLIPLRGAFNWHVLGRSSLAGDYEGRDAVFEYFGRLGQETGGTFGPPRVHVEPTREQVETFA